MQPQLQLQCQGGGPCGACKTMRRKCTVDCIFALYFPPDQVGMENFNAIHTVYGAANVAKILKEIEPSQRATAVESLAYEAKCRLKDSTYGCVGMLSILQERLKQVLQSLEYAKKELAAYNMPSQPLNDQQLALLQKQHCGNFMPMHLQQMMSPMGDPNIVIRDSQQSQQRQNSGNMVPLHLQQMMHPRGNPGIGIRDPQQSQQQQNMENMMPLHWQQMMQPRGNPGIVIRDPQESQRQQNLENMIPLHLQQIMHPRGNPGIVIQDPQQSRQKQNLENMMPSNLQEMMHPGGNPGIVIRDPQQSQEQKISKGKQLAHVDVAGEQQIRPRPHLLQSEWLEELLLQQALQENTRINQMSVASQPTSILGEYETQPPQQAAVSTQEHLQCQPLQLQQQDPSLAQQDLITRMFLQQHTQRESADDLLQQCAQPESPHSQQHMQAESIGPSQQSNTVDMLHQFARRQQSRQHMQAEGSGHSKESFTVDDLLQLCVEPSQSQQHMQAEGSGFSKESLTVDDLQLHDQPLASHSQQHAQKGFIDCGKGILMEVYEDEDDLFKTINNHMPEAAGLAVESFMIPGCSSSQSHSDSQLFQTQASKSEQNAEKEPIDHGMDILMELDDAEDQQLQTFLRSHP